jgi:ABC-2 type transport system permease protein
MRREGSALAGAGTVMMKELADNLASTRMRLLEILIFITGAGAVYATIGQVRDTIGEDPFVFLRIFTSAQDPLPSFVAFLGLLIPIVAISLGFDSVNSEFSRKTMSRILAQPIYRDALLFGKFMAGLATLAVTLAALWIFVIGLAILMLGLPPSSEEVMRSMAFLVAAIAYGAVWMALAMLFSVIFRSTATAALASLAVWLFFAFFWNMIVKIVVQVMTPSDPFDVAALISTVEFGLGLGRLSPNMLFSEAALAFLNPGERGQNLGVLLPQQLQGAISGPLPFAESVALVWPQVTGMLAGFIVLFTIAYILFQRQEVRA